MSKRARKNAKAAGTPPPAPAVTEPVPVELPTEFYFPPDDPPIPVDERDLLAVMRDWRHGRATRTIMQVISDGYIAVLSLLVLGAMLAGALLRTQSLVAVCTTSSCLTARTLLPWVVLFAVFALTLSAAHLFGPVLASAAEGSWLMDAPIRRRRLLTKRLVLPLVLAFAVGLLLGVLVALLSGNDTASIAVWGGATGLGALGLMAFAAAAQAREARGAVRIARTSAAALTAVAGAAVVSVAAGWVHLSLAPDALLPVVAGVGVAGVALAVAGTMYATTHLGEIRRARLVSGGSLVSGMQGAAFALDLGLVRDILVDRESAERGHVKPVKGRGTGIAALVWRDVERLYRWPRALPGLALSLLVPYALDALGASVVNPLLSGLALIVVLVPFLGSLRVLTRTKGLARTLPFPTTTIRTAAMVVPAILAVVWGLAATPAFWGIGAAGQERTLADAVLVSMATALAGLMGAVRWVTAKPVDFNTPMLATGAGAMPPTLVFNLFRGLDMVVLICAPVLLGWGAGWSLGLVAVVFVFLRGTFDMDELKAQQEQAMREQQALKSEKDKIRVSRPRR
ncbi:DUF6297 family protein [Propionicicella superfundia]|uniref:DUF6297 family protein n=1 Tax=Propionicicella superfundia TaxID=348582 RepID=UPI000413F79E|nr:DUF6297 family protein [Propionicicella superfundia]